MSQENIGITFTTDRIAQSIHLTISTLEQGEVFGMSMSEDFAIDLGRQLVDAITALYRPGEV